MCSHSARGRPLSLAEARAVNIINRVFGPGNWELDRGWCGDITYVRTWEGWAYLATVIDIASGRVVGWAMADHMETSLVADAVRMAITDRRPAPGLIFHADRGSQYTSGDFRRLLAANRITAPLSRPGQCWDDAVAESWFATYKTEVVERGTWPTLARLRSATFDYIEIFYNRQRLHSTRDGLSPASTVLVAGGVDIKTAQVRLGHASPLTTLRVYAQADRDGPDRRRHLPAAADRPGRATDGSGRADRAT